MKGLEKIINPRKIIKSGKTVLTLSAVLVCLGCMQIPKAGEFKEKIPVCTPHLPLIMVIKGGEYRVKKIIDENERVKGIRIRKEHWLLGERGTQEILLPENAKNMGVRYDWGAFWVYYELNEKKYVEKYNISSSARAMKKEKSYVFDKEKGEFVEEKD